MKHIQTFENFLNESVLIKESGKQEWIVFLPIEKGDIIDINDSLFGVYNDEEYDRIEDALGAVKSALRSGYVRGAGVELIQIIPFFKDSPIYDLINEVLSKPYFQILENANITRTLKTDVPFNVRTKTYDENIIDAADILINSLKNAVSLFKLLINTSYVIHNE